MSSSIHFNVFPFYQSSDSNATNKILRIHCEYSRFMWKFLEGGERYQVEVDHFVHLYYLFKEKNMSGVS